jgi:hypothetical protein
MDSRLGMPNVLMPGTLFLLKVSQALNAIRHFTEKRAKLIANDVLVKFKRLLVAVGAAQPKFGNLDNAFSTTVASGIAICVATTGIPLTMQNPFCLAGNTLLTTIKLGVLYCV